MRQCVEKWQSQMKVKSGVSTPKPKTPEDSYVHRMDGYFILLRSS
jgi:hypothetical protein